jgi:hypothetical protein
MDFIGSYLVGYFVERMCDAPSGDTLGTHRFFSKDLYVNGCGLKCPLKGHLPDRRRMVMGKIIFYHHGMVPKGVRRELLELDYLLKNTTNIKKKIKEKNKIRSSYGESFVAQYSDKILQKVKLECWPKVSSEQK